MSTLLIVIHSITCVLLVIVVLMQSGKDGGVGAMAGGSQTVFGSSGGANFFTKFTSILAAIFFFTSITLTILRAGRKNSVFEGSAAVATKTDPLPAAAAPATTPAATPTKK